MGISADLLPRVFDTFVQAPQSAAPTRLAAWASAWRWCGRS
jgi:hypothetical protein